MPLHPRGRGGGDVVCIDGLISINGQGHLPCGHCEKAVERYQRQSTQITTKTASSAPAPRQALGGDVEARARAFAAEHPDSEKVFLSTGIGAIIRIMAAFAQSETTAIRQALANLVDAARERIDLATKLACTAKSGVTIDGSTPTNEQWDEWIESCKRSGTALLEAENLALKAEGQSSPWVENGELLPCPFCTGKADWSDGEQKTEYGNEQVFCTNCLASAPPGADKSEAAEWWNRRGKPCESYADVAEKEIQVLESAFTPAVAEDEKEIFTPPSDTGQSADTEEL